MFIFPSIIIISSLLWRIRGGLWKEYIPYSKIWYSVFFSIYSIFYQGFSLENLFISFISFITCYLSYQLYGWGIYIGRLLTGENLNPETDKECELIDNLLYPLHITLKGQKYYLYQYPKLFGFCGTTLTGLIITFLWGIHLNNIYILLSGLSMGLCYWLGGRLEKIYQLGKCGWNWGEIIFGAYMGLILSFSLF